MKFPLSWLQEYILSGLTPLQLSKTLTLAGIEVDNMVTEESETFFEVSLTPNLGHCASIIGIARELAAAVKRPINIPIGSVTENSTNHISNEIAIKVESHKDCPRYACRIIKNVKVGASPEWLQRRLIACDLRPINNIVDITNFVMLELGHPLHAFDFDRLEGGTIQVRKARNGEILQTLDGKDRTLTQDDLVISDLSKCVALAGLMGGSNSEVTESTRNVVLEAAYFNPAVIRKMSKRLGLMTDASKRFERGTDPNVLSQVLDRAATLILELANGEAVAGILEFKEGDFPELKVACRLSRLNSVLGTHLSVSEVEDIFKRLEMKAEWQNPDTFQVSIPTYRNDIHAEIDLIEEVARIYGYANIGKENRPHRSSSVDHVPIYLFEREVRSTLINEGLQELLMCDLIGPTWMEIAKEANMPPEAIVEVQNPTSIEQSILRTSLVPGLLQVVKYNYDHQNHNLSGFEIGRIHFRKDTSYKEQLVVGIVLTGKSQPYHWQPLPREVDFYDLKGIIENLLKSLNIFDVNFKKSTLPAFHTGRQASIFINDLEIGSLGEIHPTIQRRMDIPQKVLFAELSLNDLFQVCKKEIKFKPLPIYPASERDWTITLPETVSLQDIQSAIQAASSQILENFILLDIYRNSEKLGKNLKNMTFRFIYRDSQKTIEQPMVDTEHKRITTQVMQFLKL